MPDNRNTAELVRQNATTANRERTNDRSAVQAVANAMRRDSDNRLDAAKRDASRWQQDAQQYQGQNPALRDRSQSERDELSKRIDAFAAQQKNHVEKSEKRATAITTRLVRTAERLEAQQREELKRANPTNVQQLRQHHAEQWRKLGELSDGVKSDLAAARERDVQRLKNERLKLGNALLRGSSASIKETMDKLDLARQRAWERAAGKERLSQHRDMDALSHAVRNTVAEISGSLSPDRAQEWRAKLGEIARDLDDAAVSRVRLAGERVKDADHAVNAVKGQLFEELMIKQEAAKLEAVAQKELDRRGIAAKAEFIAGDRIRDESGFRRLTDGIVAWKDENERLHVMKYLEAKSGLEYADKLLRTADRGRKDQAALEAGQLVMTGERFLDVAVNNAATEGQVDIRLPVLVTHGRKDRLLAFAAAEQIAAGLPNAQLYAFEGKGHLPIFTATDEFCEVLRRFVRTGTATA